MYRSEMNLYIFKRLLLLDQENVYVEDKDEDVSFL